MRDGVAGICRIRLPLGGAGAFRCRIVPISS